MNRTISTCILLVALTTASASALADPQLVLLPKVAVTVRFADLKTETARGAHILYSRINRAAVEVCGRSSGSFYPTVARLQKSCVSATVDHVVAQLSLPTLTALHLEKAQHQRIMAERQADNQ
ncbi:MAG TPA: UrcA family protein [Steroidobacteraceae bacterium]|nr:UrcA family protein [Steroidobacteraceae bacterium]